MLRTKLLEPRLTVDYWTYVQQYRSFNTLQGPNNLQLAFESKEKERPWPIWKKLSKRAERCRANTPAVLTCSLFNSSSKFQILQRLFNVFLINGCNKCRKHSSVWWIFWRKKATFVFRRCSQHHTTSRKQASTHAISNVFIQPVFHLGYQFMQTNRLEISEESTRQWHGHITLINRIFLGSKLSLLFIQKSFHYWTCYWAISSLLLQWNKYTRNHEKCGMQVQALYSV